jgi:hypothetical protein
VQGAASSDSSDAGLSRWSHGRRAAIVVVELPTHAVGAPLGAVATLAFGDFPCAILLAAYLQQGLSEGKAGRETFHAHAAILGG